jgi:hypothetical protein
MDSAFGKQKRQTIQLLLQHGEMEREMFWLTYELLAMNMA